MNCNTQAAEYVSLDPTDGISKLKPTTPDTNPNSRHQTIAIGIFECSVLTFALFSLAKTALLSVFPLTVWLMGHLPFESYRLWPHRETSPQTYAPAGPPPMMDLSTTVSPRTVT